MAKDHHPKKVIVVMTTGFGREGGEDLIFESSHAIAKRLDKQNASMQRFTSSVSLPIWQDSLPVISLDCVP